MPEAHSHSRPSRVRLSRRTWLGLVVPLLLVAAYLAVTQGVRSHVDGLIQQSVGKVLPAFELVDTAGEAWSTERLRGKRVLLHFFRSYCGSCDAEAPGWRALETRLPDDVVLLHVMTDVVQKVSPEVTAATIAKKGFARPVVMADAAFLEAFHRVNWSNVTPITYVVDAKGLIRFGLRGRQEPEVVSQALSAAI